MTKLDILWELILLILKSNLRHPKLLLVIIFSFPLSLLPSLVKAQEAYKLINLGDRHKQLNLLSPQNQEQQQTNIVTPKERISRTPQSIKIDNFEIVGDLTEYFILNKCY